MSEAPSPSFLAFGEAMLRVANISYWQMLRRESYTELEVTMSDGTSFRHRDWQGSAYELEKKLREAVGA